MNDLDKMLNDAFADGLRYALQDLEEVYGDGLHETDIWIAWMENDEEDSE